MTEDPLHAASHADMGWRGEVMAWVREHPWLTTILVLAVLLVLFWIVQAALFNLGGTVPGNGEGEIIQRP